MNPIGMTLVFVITLGMFAWSAVRRVRLMQTGAPLTRFPLGPSALRQRIENTLVYALVQKKMPRNPRYMVAGAAHIAIFAAFNVLLLNSIILWVRGYLPEFDAWGYLGRDALLGQGYSFAKEIAAMGAIGGCAVFAYYRVVRRPERMTLGGEGLLILFIIASMMMADYVYVAADLVRDVRLTGGDVHWHPSEPFGSALALAFADLEGSTIVVLEHVGFWWHATWVLLFLNLLPHGKHFHVLTVLPNIFAGPLDPPGKLPDVDDLEGKIENDEPVGIAKIEHLNWKHILDLYTCTECGRCSDNCPAFTTGKKLSPKHLTLALRDHLYQREPVLLGTGGIERPAGAEKSLVVPAAWPEGYSYAEGEVSLVPDLVDPEVIWACTTCRACEEQCPVNISYVDKIVEMRRAEYMLKDEYPRELGKMWENIEVNGNPWNLPSMDRGNWAEGLEAGGAPVKVPLLSDHPSAEVIYWVGCAANYDDNAQKVARAVAKLLRHAGVDFAILGSEATCTGDPARRSGNEYLFQMLAEQNVETLNGYGASNKTVITACPHCFNTLANEYAAFGGKYDVVHHSAFLNGLLAQGRLVPSRRVDATVAYHDSCYLGRYNEVYEEPREVLQSIPGVKLVEVEYWNRERGLCCGMGGGQAFKEEEHGSERVSAKRTLQLIDTGADTIATGCPFCTIALDESLKSLDDAEDGMTQLDVALLLERSVDFDKATVEDAAE